jgi:hypothetical protein
VERFELSIVAQGSQSIWVAVIVVALICFTVTTVSIIYAILKSSKHLKREQRE